MRRNTEAILRLFKAKPYAIMFPLLFFFSDIFSCLHWLCFKLQCVHLYCNCQEIAPLLNIAFLTCFGWDNYIAFKLLKEVFKIVAACFIDFIDCGQSVLLIISNNKNFSYRICGITILIWDDLKYYITCRYSLRPRPTRLQHRSEIFGFRSCLHISVLEDAVESRTTNLFSMIPNMMLKRS